MFMTTLKRHLGNYLQMHWFTEIIQLQGVKYLSGCVDNRIEIKSPETAEYGNSLKR